MITQLNALSYSLKIWLSSVFVGPAIFFIIDYLRHGGTSAFRNGMLDIYFLFVIFGGLFSFVTWITFHFLMRIVITAFVSRVSNVKYLIAFLGASLTVVTFLIVPHDLIGSDVITIAISYALTIAAGSLIYNFDIEYEPETNL
ncbi:hypothetical protein INP83_01390 [Mucilaginibacter sp. 21P]|uniref:hypothetical protein n=1 Tax=Mucilaginibacter sp. 21P TaxID=2778902 RepID=UPI001C55DBB8|nr:hypothetical protein [Mucilaginibacter sp. 21P]QXV65779.1 hypothetical protein INP83_01390 [Mucilaginibacter sp. 21P]